MNVLIAIHHFPPHYIGGAEWRAYRTAKELIARGHQVRILSIENITGEHGDEISFEDEIYRGIRVRRLFYNLQLAPNPVQWEFNNPWIGDQLTHMIREERPDIFHLFSGYLMTASVLNTAKELGVASVLSATDFWFFCRMINLIKTNSGICHDSLLPLHEKATCCAQCLGEARRRFRIPGGMAPKVMQSYWKHQTKPIQEMEERAVFLQNSLDQVDAIICPSKFLRDYYKQAGLDEDQLYFSRQGVDLNGIQPSQNAPRPRRLRIGYIGQISQHKGIHVLLNAISKLPDADLEVKIYGNPNSFPTYTQKLKEMAQTDARIRFMNTYDQSEINDIFNNLDILVIPSVWFENSPNVILEAFAFKVPVIATNLGGMAELIQENVNGFLFESGNAAELADKIRLVLRDPTILQKLAVQTPPVKSLQEEMDELISIYRTVVQG